MMTPLLVLNDICKTYKSFELKNVSFSIMPGSICGFVGINGAGKSTTIRIIEGLCHPDSGNISLFGSNNRTRKLNNDVGYVTDTCPFYEKQSIKQIARIISKLYLDWDKDEYVKYIKMFKLDENKKISELSKGMKTQLQLALALSHNAKLLIMDEPTSGLDPYIRDQILLVLKEYVKNGERSVLFSTHISSDLEKVADKVIFIHEGRIMLEKEISELQLVFESHFERQWKSLDECIVSYVNEFKMENM